MKCKKTDHHKANYPTYPEATPGGHLRNIIMGASVTAAMALTGCAEKKSANTETTPTPPPRTGENGAGTPKTPLPMATPKAIIKNPVKPDPPRPLGEPPVPRMTKSDRDNDGIPDDVDSCPDTPGVKSRQGCPVPRLRGKMVLPTNPHKP
ncbi:hypothetical protein KKF84_07880 [Myxococcota bacterium]|nr:hypothetical protein [Myxococcota bacterium]MBU1535225.1 hypothetical protein [Myxococcota bacterium]